MTNVTLKVDSSYTKGSTIALLSNQRRPTWDEQLLDDAAINCVELGWNLERPDSLTPDGTVTINYQLARSYWSS